MVGEIDESGQHYYIHALASKTCYLLLICAYQSFWDGFFSAEPNESAIGKLGTAA